MRKVFLEDLPKKDGNGLSKGKQVINWKECIGKSVKFVYDDIKGEVYIVDYNKNYLYLQYLNKDVFKINTGHFRQCKLGNILNEFTKNFKLKIGTHIVDDKRNLIIIDREYRDNPNNKGTYLKYYRYKCNKCGWNEGWIVETALITQKQGCGCCCQTPRVVVEGINDIPTTTPWMVKYFQGGYDEAKLYTKNTDRRITPICPDCGKVKNKTLRIQDIYKEHSIGCQCGDGISYPEKIMCDILYQLKLDYIMHSNKKVLKWCGNYIYDFYIPSLACIVETHGIQHYKQRNGSRLLKEEQENDRLKEQIAKENGIENYIVINCSESELDYIKNNIINSEFINLLNVKDYDIDWNKAENFALNNLVKKACDYKKDNPSLTTIDIGKFIKLSDSTIRTYLKKGAKLGWCEYDVNEEIVRRNIKGANNSAKVNGKSVEIIKDGISLGIFSKLS